MKLNESMYAGIIRWRCRYLLWLLLFPLLLSGCRNMVEVDGERYAALNDEEMHELVLLARTTLVRNAPKLISQEEAEKVRRTAPQVKVEYYGDCFGEVIAMWDLPTRKVEVVIDGKLNDSSPSRRNVMVRIMKKYAPVLDFRDAQRRGNNSALQQP